MSQIAYSSVPAWARPDSDDAGQQGCPASPDLTGSSYLLVGVGDAGRAATAELRGRLPDVPVTVVIADDAESALSATQSAIAESTVGVRVAICGPVGACLRLRGVAVAAGLEDDEITVTPCGTADIDVFCSHCGAVTSAVAAIDDVVTCTGCARNLLVYHHVSRRTGHYLGFMVDAETSNPSIVATSGRQ